MFSNKNTLPLVSKRLWLGLISVGFRAYCHKDTCRLRVMPVPPIAQTHQVTFIKIEVIMPQLQNKLISQAAKADRALR